MHALFPPASVDPLVIALAVFAGLGAVGLSCNAQGFFRGVSLLRIIRSLFCRRPQAEPGTDPSMKETKK